MQELAGCHVLVTGGAGFIGSHLVERLLERGVRVTVLDNFDDFYDPARKRANLAAVQGRAELRVVEGDVRDAPLLARLFREGTFDQVVHIAARAGVRPSIEQPLLYEDVNVRGTLVLLEAMRAAGCRRLVFASSSSVYGAASRVPFRETDPCDRPISPYAATKRACELAIWTYHHLYGIQAALLRLFTVYGPRQRPDLAIARFARRMLAGEPIPVYGDGSFERDFTYIDDILQGVLGAMQRLEGCEIYNLGGAVTTSVNELIRLLERVLGVPARIERLPVQPGDVPRTWADITKARQRLGYEPQVPLAEGLARYAAWLGAGPH
ncbi:MAG: epimerase [Planctomycetota bacterium]|nr:MAG: epimerase [Planctomycetota bacterium]